MGASCGPPSPPAPTPPPPSPTPVSDCCVIPASGWEKVAAPSPLYFAGPIADTAGDITKLEALNYCVGVGPSDDLILLRPDGIWEEWTGSGVFIQAWSNSTVQSRCK